MFIEPVSAVACDSEAVENRDAQSRDKITVRRTSDLNLIDLVIVADGAAHHLSPEFKPSIVCGDFDSLDLTEMKCTHRGAEFVHLPDQSTSDLEKAISLARSRGATQITIAGAFGGRIDHSLSAVSVLLRYHRECAISIVEHDSTLQIVSPAVNGGAARVDCKRGDIVSLIPFSLISVVTISGVEWPLNRAELAAGTGGVSNRATEDAVQLVVHEGVVALCYLPERWAA